MSLQTDWRHRPSSSPARSTTQTNPPGRATPAARSSARRPGGRCGLEGADGPVRGALPACIPLCGCQAAQLGMKGREEGWEISGHRDSFHRHEDVLGGRGDQRSLSVTGGGTRAAGTAADELSSAQCDSRVGKPSGPTALLSAWRSGGCPRGFTLRNARGQRSPR